MNEKVLEELREKFEGKSKSKIADIILVESGKDPDNLEDYYGYMELDGIYMALNVLRIDELFTKGKENK